MLTTIINYIKGLYRIINSAGAIFLSIMWAGWNVIAILLALCIVLAPHIADFMEYVAMHISAAVGILTNSHEAWQAAATAGWPMALASGVSFVNQCVPLAEAAGMLITLGIIYYICWCIRIIKGIIPVLWGS